MREADGKTSHEIVMAINKKFISDHKRGPERGLGALAPIPEDSNQFLNPIGQSSTAPTSAPED